ncbi:hypothetical protein ACNKHN_21895 [Shigella flexneri]
MTIGRSTGWRWAQVKFIKRFLDGFPGAETIRLEPDYRSRSNILSALTP